MKRSGMVVVALILVLGLASCGIFPGAEQGIDLTGLTPEIPGVIARGGAPAPDSAGTQSFGRLASTTDQELLDELSSVYQPVWNQYNVIGVEAIQFVDDLLAGIEENIFDAPVLRRRAESGEILVIEYTEADDRPAVIRVAFTQASNTWVIEQWRTDAITNPGDPQLVKNLHVTLVQSAEGDSGTITVRDLAEAAEVRTTWAVDFSTDPDGNASVVLRGDQLDYDDPTDPEDNLNIPSRIWLEAAEADDRFVVTGNISYAMVDPPDTLAFRDEYLSVLNGGSVPDGDLSANYLYRAVVNTETDNASIELALVPADYAGTDFFSEYSVGAVYREAIGNWVLASDGEDPDYVAALNAALSLDPPLTSASSVADVFDALEALAAAEPDNADLAGVLFAVKLTNPAYLEPTFVGGEPSGQLVATAGMGTAAIPDWADEVAPPADLLPPTPEFVNGTGFSVVMPEDVPAPTAE